MTANVKTTRFSAWASLLLALITYFISIKGKLGLTELPFLPDAFLLSLFGGAFASMLVVLACEISKYEQNKQTAEAYFVYHLYYLYGQLQIILNTLLLYNTNNDIAVPQNALTQPINNAKSEIDAVLFAEYVPFLKKSKFLAEKERFNHHAFFTIQRTIHECTFLEIARLKDEIDLNNNRIRVLQKQNTNPEPQNVKKTLDLLLVSVETSLQEIDDIVSRLDQLCKGKFNWSQMRDQAVQGTKKVQMYDFETFLSQSKQSKQ